MWVRGLKRPSECVNDRDHRSHPMWVRGLKQSYSCVHSFQFLVAPYVGAWIETLSQHKNFTQILCRTLCGCVD